jgi:hypothetical protein
MEGVILKQDSPDWLGAWGWLDAHPINTGLPEPKVALNQGEVWQYMGSYLKDGILISDFRHRCHPRTNDLYRLSFKHPEYEEASIELRRPIK